MSRLYFHAPSSELPVAELHGAEFAHLGGLCRDIAHGYIPDLPTLLEPLLTRQLRQMAAAQGDRRMYDLVRTMFAVSDTPVFHRAGVDLANVPLRFNTVQAVGNDTLCLVVKLAAQGEINSWIDGPHRPWVAHLIEQGRSTAMLRDKMGWDRLVAVLRSSTTEPLVTSYTVQGGFPDPPPGLIDRDDDEAADAWWSQPYRTRWAQAWHALMVRSRSHLLQIAPDTLRASFGHGYNLFHVLHQHQPPQEGTPT